jgi:hypothetical protein
LARAWALAPEAVTARAEIVRSILDLLGATPARRLAAIRELIARSADVERALSRVNGGAGAASAPVAAGGRRSRRAAPTAAAPPGSPAITTAAAVDKPEPDTSDDVGATDTSGQGDPDEPRDTRAPASERRRAATTLVAIWREVARDLAVAGLGDDRLVRDAGLLDELRAAAGISPADLGRFLERLDRSGELIEANASPELVLDVLVLSWPRLPRAA